MSKLCKEVYFKVMYLKQLTSLQFSFYFSLRYFAFQKYLWCLTRVFLLTSSPLYYYTHCCIPIPILCPTWLLALVLSLSIYNHCRNRFCTLHIRKIQKSNIPFLWKRSESNPGLLRTKQMAYQLTISINVQYLCDISPLLKK